MIKWFLYIASFLIFIPCLSSARPGFDRPVHPHYANYLVRIDSAKEIADTTVNKNKQQKQPETDDKKKIKEIAKAKRLPKPEKVEEPGSEKGRRKRQRRPPGMERPPEIPRRNGN